MHSALPWIVAAEWFGVFGGLAAAASALRSVVERRRLRTALDAVQSRAQRALLSSLLRRATGQTRQSFVEQTVPRHARPNPGL
jgi:hypothetical protein